MVSPIPVLAALGLLAAPAIAQAPAALHGPKAPEGSVRGLFVLPDRPVWSGEVFDLTLAWKVDWDLYRALEGDPVWKPDPLVVERWTRGDIGKPAPEGGRNLGTITLSTQAMALRPGTINLSSPRQQMQLVTGGYETDGVKIATIGEAVATGAGATLQVKPLPPAPPGFAGAVGDFSLASTLDGKRGEVGKPLVWTVTLAGKGNWSALAGVPARMLPRAFDVIGQPETKAEKEDSLFTRSLSEQIRIVPKAAGHYSLGPIEMSVFDPRAGRYVTITAPAIALDVVAGAVGSQPPAYEAEPAPPAAEERLPPPLSGTGHARPPLPVALWRVALALPILAVGLLWLGLAWMRARAADPERVARRAHRGLTRTLAALVGEPDPARRRTLVRAWQRDAVLRLKIGHAAPDAGAFAAAGWSELWHEAELHLYARGAPLPPDWEARAQAALAAHGQPPRFNPLAVVAARNLYPLAAMIVALLLACPAPSPAAPHATPATRAEAGPLDWIARYDFALGQAEAKLWNLAAAHAGIAWVQQPRSAETAALWIRTAREAGLGGRAAGGLPLPNDERGKFTGLLGPAAWQMTALLCLAVAAGGAALFLLRRFGHLSRRVGPPAVVAGVLGLAGAVAALAGLDGYGPAGAPDAAIVTRPLPFRDLPIDTPDDDAPLTLAPGTVGHMGRVFMDWVEVTLASGRRGWVRREELLPLWRTRP